LAEFERNAAQSVIKNLETDANAAAEEAKKQLGKLDEAATDAANAAAAEARKAAEAMRAAAKTGTELEIARRKLQERAEEAAVAKAAAGTANTLDSAKQVVLDCERAHQPTQHSASKAALRASKAAHDALAATRRLHGEDLVDAILVVAVARACSRSAMAAAKASGNAATCGGHGDGAGGAGADHAPPRVCILPHGLPPESA
jgi:hypothetical protein